jgi:hypothetical protein
MSLWDAIKSLLHAKSVVPSDVPKLAASTERELSASLRSLLDGERGWITFSEARRLFSQMDDEYAFGEMDEKGKDNLPGFAAKHHSTVDLMPVEGRIYFTRRMPRKGTE